LILRGTLLGKSKKSEQLKMSNRLTREHAVNLRRSAIRECDSVESDLLAQWLGNL